MSENLNVKKSLVIQSFAPLFLLLTIKYFDLVTYKKLAIDFFRILKEEG